MKYYDDYPTEPIGDGNPYHMCSYCHIPVPGINGILENHSEYCKYRKLIEKDKEIEWLKFLIKSIMVDLPSNRDWLNPDIEKAMRDVK